MVLIVILLRKIYKWQINTKKMLIIMKHQRTGIKTTVRCNYTPTVNKTDQVLAECGGTALIHWWWEHRWVRSI